jgi:hypothetical protein
LPAGGVTWDYLHYPLGFARLGCDVFYVEDTRLWPVYQDEGGGADCGPNVQHLAAVMEAFGFEGRWAYRDEASGQCYGMTQRQLDDLCRSADVFVNVSCSTFMRDQYRQIPARVLIDTDPMFTQIQCMTNAMFTRGQPGLHAMVHAHSHWFTFGENVGQPDCQMPSCGINWRATRQPICLEHWPARELPMVPRAAYTTVMNWSAAPPLDYAGEQWGQKNIEFMRLLDLPRQVPGIPLAIAVGQTTGAPFPRDEAQAHGWTVYDPRNCAADWAAYRHFIYDSRGEFAVAKQTYVQGRTGWFSCRSACYLAAGRPVVIQDTGWTKYIPCGKGLLAFVDQQQAIDALRQVEADPVSHAREARKIAAEYFDSDIVLGKLLREMGA